MIKNKRNLASSITIAPSSNIKENERVLCCWSVYACENLGYFRSIAAVKRAKWVNLSRMMLTVNRNVDCGGEHGI